jgi:hypothetical protein
MIHDRLNAECLCMPSLPGPALAAPHGVFLPRRIETALLASTHEIGRSVRRLRPRSPAVDNAGIFNSFDFHVTADGPRLIEINVNAGGAFLQPAISAAAAPRPQDCRLAIGQPAPFSPAETIVNAWHRHAGTAALRRVAIVDDRPDLQPLHCDMLAARDALTMLGIACDILDVGDVSFDGRRLTGPSGPIDMVYNRWTDFTWSSPESLPLRLAHQAGATLVAPNPGTWRAWADKSLLLELAADPARPAAVLDAEAVTPDTADGLWQRRKQLVFKPLEGFASRGVYRGDKISRRKWEEICRGGYLAQALAAPGLRTLPTVSGLRPFKIDIRVWTHADTPLHIAARLSAGQVTGLSGEAEGFAPIFWLEDGEEAGDACGC